MSNNTKNSRLGRGLSSLLGGYPEEEKEVKIELEEEGKAKQQANAKKDVSVEKQKEKSKPSENFHATSTKEAVRPAKSSVPDAARVWKLAVDKLQANAEQPRQEFREEKLKELSASIKEQGILQPIVARKLPTGKFEIVSGERRWRAAQMAGLHDVPVILRNVDNRRSLELAIIENVQRDDLNAVEEAEAYYRLQKEFGLTQEEIAKRVGKERATVANLLRLLQLDPDVRKMLMKEELTQGHAKVLLSINEALEQKKMARKASQKKWSVRQLEKEIKKAKTSKADKNAMDVDVSKQLAEAIGEDIQKITGTKVRIDYSSGKGKIVLHFYSDEQLTEITDRIKGAWL